VAVRTRWRHQRGKARDEFEWRAVQLVGQNTSLCVALVAPGTARLAVLLGSAVNELLGLRHPPSNAEGGITLTSINNRQANDR
jgi:hypothetical protein